MSFRCLCTLSICALCTYPALSQEHEPLKDVPLNECRYILIQGDSTPNWLLSINPSEAEKIDYTIGTGRFTGNMSIPEGNRVSLLWYGIADWQRMPGSNEIDVRPLLGVDPQQLCAVKCHWDEKSYLTDESLRALTRFRSLKVLGFRLRKPLDAPAVLTRFGELEALSLSYSIASESGRDITFSCPHDSGIIDAIRRLQHLKSLFLHCALLGPEDIKDISQMSSLRSLSLPSVKGISDDDLLNIQNMPNLRELSLGIDVSEGHVVSDGAVLKFAEMRELKWLDIRIPGVSKKTFNELQRRMPNAEVHWQTLRSNK